MQMVDSCFFSCSCANWGLSSKNLWYFEFFFECKQCRGIKEMQGGRLLPA